MTQEQDKLLPCPFCGSNDVEISWYARGKSPDRAGYFVECVGCSASGEGFDIQGGVADREAYAQGKAITAWNTRTQEAPTQPDVVELLRRASERLQFIGDQDMGLLTEIDAALSTPKEQADQQDEASALHPILAAIAAEVEKATAKFPTWPTRIIDAGNVVSEEAGELAKACLQVTYEKDKETLDGVREEAIQTAAMCVRFLASMDRYDCEPAEQHEQPSFAALKGDTK